MEELLKQVFLSRFLAVIIITIWAISVLIGIIKKSQSFESRKKCIIVRSIVCPLVMSLWLVVGYFTAYNHGLACYEYNNNITSEAAGVIDSIDHSKDTTQIVVNGKKYKMVYSIDEPIVDFRKDIVEGDSVKFKYGKNSKFIFDIYEIEPQDEE